MIPITTVSKSNCNKTNLKCQNVVAIVYATYKMSHVSPIIVGYVRVCFLSVCFFFFPNKDLSLHSCHIDTSTVAQIFDLVTEFNFEFCVVNGTWSQ